MASLTVENYVKTIFHICGGDCDEAVATGAVAVALNVSPGTVTSMLKTLNEDGLATYTPYEGVRLTATGLALALRMIRRHRLIESFLSRTLELQWDEVHEDAEQMEHVLSDSLVERIDMWLGRPKWDPHGDPIPAADGTMVLPEGEALVDCEPGFRFRLVRVLDQSRDFLQFLSRAGLSLGVQGRVVENLAQAGTVTVEVADHQLTLGREAAGNLLVAATQPSNGGVRPSRIRNSEVGIQR